jgi:hypothetical protein
MAANWLPQLIAKPYWIGRAIDALANATDSFVFDINDQRTPWVTKEYVDERGARIAAALLKARPQYYSDKGFEAEKLRLGRIVRHFNQRYREVAA